MGDPAKVLGFLDLAGAWDPSLAFAVARRRTRSLLGLELQLPQGRGIDRRLVLGGFVFGMDQAKAAVFVLAMLAGMEIFEWRERRRAGST